MLMLGIETSCDETSAALVKDGKFVLSNIISSQIDIHKEFGGVVPEIASRKHTENIGTVVDKALEEANVGFDDIDAVCVTYGPGLVGALLVGLNYGKALAFAIKKPLIGVNHVTAHICANFLFDKHQEEVKPPFLCLVVSGGHTSLVYCKDYLDFELLGQTLDDACGEAYDKVARALGLSYPGGPIIDKLSEKGNENAYVFPQALSGDKNLDFSFSGVKSSVLNTINKAKMKGEEVVIEDVCASFQKAVTDVLVNKTMNAMKLYNTTSLVLAGGVCANRTLRKKMVEKSIQNGYNLHIPESIFCTDNAAMICACGYFKFLKGKTDNLFLNALPSLSFDKI